ncbi:MAG: NAD(P)H-dependent oxidoreductase [Candidatus Competibacteraceae bacterium]|nr:NAD(P)H-dependent oxidoreductase [Candidatus Competibacteraceae bacterium]
MTTLLQINSSLFAEQGASSQLADTFVDQYHQSHPHTRLIRRDLGTEPLPHLDAQRITAIMTPPDQRTAEQQNIAAQADQLIREVQQADILVLGVPMYNFSVPSTLKAWFDHIARAGVTFRYTQDGPEGLLKGKRAYVFTTRGGLHQGQASDSQTPFVATFLNFLGIEDIEFVYAEGLNMGQEHKQAGLRQAGARIEQLLAA